VTPRTKKVVTHGTGVGPPDAVRIGTDVREQLSGALEGHGPVTGPDERRREPVSDKSGIVGN